MNKFRSALLVIAVLFTVVSNAHAQATTPPPVTITLAGYAVPREAYGDIIPLFQAYWQKKTGQQVIVLESYQGSGAQSRAISGGFEADIASLSLEPDITRLVDAKLVSPNWKSNNPYQGFVSQSLVVLAVRPDNPRKINDWADLAKKNLEIITPDPATSGGAQWNILAAVGAAKRGFVGDFKGDDGFANFLRALLTNVSVLDKDGRESFLTFERGIGDVAITYENEVYAGLINGGKYQLIYPASTILIENPVTIVDTYVDKHGTRAVAEEFVKYLWTPEIQRVFANHGFRPVNPAIRKELGITDPGYATQDAASAVATASAATAHNPLVKFAPVKDLFTIDLFGGWKRARPDYFGDKGIYTKLIAEVKGK